MNKIEKYNEITFEKIKHFDKFGNEYWEARELMDVLGYSKWGNFKKVIDKAKITCDISNNNIIEHFADVGKVLIVGNNAKMNIDDYNLSRYACYLIVQNADPRKKSVALDQTYFAVQTRKQELTELEYSKLSEDEKRLYTRISVKNKKIKEIIDCEKCDLYKNQKPLLDKEIKCDVMWVGLSAKRIDDINLNYPLENNTISGKLIEEIENRRPNLKFYKTNLVKCLPIDKCNKLRYPHKDEMCCCIENLLVEIDLLKPKLIFLLGNIVSDFVTKYVNENSYKGNIKFIKIEHPSYISIYKKKQKEKYIEKVLKHIDKDI